MRSGGLQLGFARSRLECDWLAPTLEDLGRPKFLIYSTVLFTIGIAVAVRDGRPVNVRWWIGGQIFVWCVHLMTHYCNEYFDLDADSANTSPTRWTGGSRVLVDRLLSPNVSLATAFVLLFAALVFVVDMPWVGARALAATMIALSWFYTAPPLRFNYRGLGELVVAGVLNVLAPMLAFTLQTHEMSWLLLGLLAPTFFAQHLRMMVMNLSDHAGDRSVGKNTLPVLLGPTRATRMVVYGQIIVYGLVALSPAVRVPLAAMMAMLLTLPIAIWQARRLRKQDERTANSVVFWASSHVALLAFGALAGVLIDAALRRPLGPALLVCVAISATFLVALVTQVHQSRAHDAARA